MTFDHVILKATEQIGLHSQNSWELSYIVKGHGERQIGDSRSPFAEGDMVLVVPNMPHHWVFEEDDEEQRIENITIIFDVNFIAKAFSQIPELEKIKEFYINLRESIVICGETRDKISRLMFCMKGVSEAERIIVLMHILCLIGNEARSVSAGKFLLKQTKEDKLNKAMIYLRCNYKKHFFIKDIADHIGMSEAGFCKFWKKMTGRTFLDCLIEQRISAAKDLFHNPDCLVKEVCFESGFNDVAYFSKTFKRITGMSPSQFRLAANNKKKDDL